MNGSVNVAVVVFVEVVYGLDYLAWLLGGCSVVKIDKRIAIYFSV